MTNKLISYLNQFDLKWGYLDHPVPLSFKKYQKSIERGNAGPLEYLKDHRMDMRSSLLEVFPTFKSALVFAFPITDAVAKLNKIYEQANWNGLKIAPYSFAFEGRDYHFAIAEILEEISSELKDHFGLVDYKISVDIDPIMERDLAHRAGLGVWGSNTILINKEYGSYFLIGEILLDCTLPLEVSKRLEGDCGNCCECKTKCPTGAINTGIECIHCKVCRPKCPPAARVKGVDAGKCLCTFTVEQFKDVEAHEDYQKSDYFFGCNICQDVCPWNKSVVSVEGCLNLSKTEKFIADFFLLRPIPEIVTELEGMSNRAYKKLFKGTSFERTGRIGLLKNLTNHFRYTSK